MFLKKIFCATKMIQGIVVCFFLRIFFPEHSLVFLISSLLYFFTQYAFINQQGLFVFLLTFETLKEKN